MGLDLWHCKASLRVENESHEVTEFDALALDSYNLQRFLQPVPFHWATVHEVWVVEHEQDLQRLMRDMASLNGINHMSHDISLVLAAEVAARLPEIEVRHGLCAPGIDRYESEWRQLGSRREQPVRARDWIQPQPYFGRYRWVIYERASYGPGIYYTGAGYQRKGMGHAFYEVYDHDRIYVERQDFVRLLDYAYPDCPEVRVNLQRHFVDNYEEGISFLTISW